jgi:hypothetical protein
MLGRLGEHQFINATSSGLKSNHIYCSKIFIYVFVYIYNHSLQSHGVTKSQRHNVTT